MQRTGAGESSFTQLRDAAERLRRDQTEAIAPALPDNPHTFLVPLGDPVGTAVGFAAMQQGLAFPASGTEAVPEVNPMLRALLGAGLILFETPASLPER